MEESELVYIATKAFEKKRDYGTLKYGDDLYDNEKYAEYVWEYVEEIQNIGKIKFKEKYDKIEMYPGF